MISRIPDGTNREYQILHDNTLKPLKALVQGWGSLSLLPEYAGSSLMMCPYHVADLELVRQWTHQTRQKTWWRLDDARQLSPPVPLPAMLSCVLLTKRKIINNGHLDFTQNDRQLADDPVNHEHSCHPISSYLHDIHMQSMIKLQES